MHKIFFWFFCSLLKSAILKFGVFDFVEVGGGMKKKNQKKKRKWEIGFLHNFLRWWKWLDKKSKGIFVAAAGFIAVVLMVAIWALALRDRSVPVLSEEVATVTVAPKTPKETKQPISVPKSEGEIYSYLQGPKSWGRGLKWSGEWGELYVDGGSFE